MKTKLLLFPTTSRAVPVDSLAAATSGHGLRHQFPVHGGRVLVLFGAMVAASPLPAQIAQQAYVKASNTRTEMRFGTSCAISGDTMVIGAPHERSANPGVNGDQNSAILPGAGAAYVFVRAANGAWTQQAYLKASDPREYATFGEAVAISDNLRGLGGGSGRHGGGGKFDPPVGRALPAKWPALGGGWGHFQPDAEPALF